MRSAKINFVVISMNKFNKKTLQLVFAIVIVFFIVAVFLKQYRSISLDNITINWIGLVASISLYFVAVTLQALIWNQLIELIEHKKYSLKDLFSIYIPSWLASYIPGKIGSIGYKVILGANKNISKITILFTSLSEIIIFIFLGFIVSVPAVVNNKTIIDSNKILLFAFLLLVSLMIFFNPKIFTSVINKLYKYFTKKTAQINIGNSYKKNSLLVFVLEYFLIHIIYGIGFFFLANSLQDYSHLNLLFLISSWALAQVVGMITIISPSGIGVKEAVLTLLLSTQLPLEIAIAISVASRLWTITSDVLLYLIFLFCSKFMLKKSYVKK